MGSVKRAAAVQIAWDVPTVFSLGVAVLQVREGSGLSNVPKLINLPKGKRN